MIYYRHLHNFKFPFDNKIPILEYSYIFLELGSSQRLSLKRVQRTEGRERKGGGEVVRLLGGPQHFHTQYTCPV